MGSGKSTIGKQLASALNFSFLDLDAEIESAEGNSISDIFSEKGEIYFRKKENEVLREVLSINSNIVLATGGGTPCYGAVMEYLSSKKDVVVIYLKVSLHTLTERLVLEKDKRPLIAHLSSEKEVKDFIRKHLFERSYYYNQATFNIAVDGASISEIVEKSVLQLF